MMDEAAEKVCKPGRGAAAWARCSNSRRSATAHWPTRGTQACSTLVELPGIDRKISEPVHATHLARWPPRCPGQRPKPHKAPHAKFHPVPALRAGRAPAIVNWMDRIIGLLKLLAAVDRTERTKPAPQDVAAGEEEVPYRTYLHGRW